MKKRRILALLLALSMAVGTNGMSVLAMEPGVQGVAVMTEDSGSIVGKESGSPDSWKTEETDADGSDGQDSGGAADEGTDSDTANDQENQGAQDAPSQEEPENQGTQGSLDQEDQGTQGGSDQDAPSDQGSGADSGDENQPSDSDSVNTDEGKTDGEVVDPDETADELGNPEDATGGEDLPDGEDAAEEPEEPGQDKTDEENKPAGTKALGVKMVSFTDDTGMMVTYNVNEEYQIEVKDGVLESIKDAEGKSVSGVVAVPEERGIKAIGAAFKGNADITYVKLPAGVTSIQDDAFNNCYKLEGIYLPTGLKTIGNNAFYRCTGLVKIAIPKQVVSIGDSAFYQNSKLFMVYMKDADHSSLVSIGARAFYECKVLEEFCSDDDFEIPGRLETIGDFAFYECRSIKDVDFNESVKTIGESAFQGCNSMKELTLSSSITEIPKSAFEGCNKLVEVEMKPGVRVIGEAAFRSCTQLGGLKIPGTVSEIKDLAFASCTGLMAVEVNSTSVVYGDGVFPDISTLTLIGLKDSTTEEYAFGKKIRFVAWNDNSGKKQYYKYDISYQGEGKGKLTIQDADAKDPNTLNNKQGVTSGTLLYIFYQPENGSRLVSGSIKCNGESVEKDDQERLYFYMPIGGARITAEFEITASSNKIKGIDKDVKVEISNGETVTDATGEVASVSLKIGQSSRMFLTDAADDNKAIPSSKVTYTTSNSSVVSVDKDGTFRAKAQGYSNVTAKVVGDDGVNILRTVRVDVASAKVAQIKLLPRDYDVRTVTIEKDQSGDAVAAVIDKNRLTQDVKFELRATAYDESDDDVAVALRWSSSDSRIAKLDDSSTDANDPENEVTVPAGVNGEATIRVTATNADKKTVTQKFVIRVVDDQPRLVSKSLTVNPKRTDGALLQIISSYGKSINAQNVKLVRKESNGDKIQCRELSCTYLAGESDDVVSTFEIKPYVGLQDQVFQLYVIISETYELPLKVTVKSSKPNAKVAFEKKQPKLNLFYANDGTQFKVNVSNLGKDEVSEYELRPLTESDDDKLFLENFAVEYVSKNSCVITQASDNLETAKNGKSKGKPVVSGYLRLRFEGYSDEVYQDCKITIPTQTSKPSYKLNRAADTFKRGCESQEIELQFLDNKKNAADMSYGGYRLKIINGDDDSRVPVEVPDDGYIDVDDEGRFTLTLKDSPSPGKVNLWLSNDELWASGQGFKYTYTVKLTGSAPKISLTDGPSSTTALKGSTITMNPVYAGQTVQFGLQSNQKGIMVAEEQEFIPQKKAATEAQYDKLDVQYAGGSGWVTLLDETIKDGTYTFVCNKSQYVFGSDELPANKVTLKVKIKRTQPGVAVKGSIALNNTARTDGAFVERSELALVIKNLPEDYELDLDETLSSITCITKNYENFAEKFNWELTDRELDDDGKMVDAKLSASLNGFCDKKTYKFSMVPTFTGIGTTLTAKKVNFSVKVHDGTISMVLSAKGKINLLDRSGECTAANSIIYTPTLKNVKDKVIDAKVFDYDPYGRPPKYDDPESEFFEASVSADGKIYVVPREGVAFKSNVTQQVQIWAELENYKFSDSDAGAGIFSKKLSIKTSQILPKLKTSTDTVNLYLSNKNYVATFIVEKQDANAIGNLESVTFGTGDKDAPESFVTIWDEVSGKNNGVECEQLSDGSLKVKLRLRDSVSFSNDSTNKVKMYVRFEGQGTNTPGTSITINAKINR